MTAHDKTSTHDTEILVVDDRHQDLLAIEGILSTRDYTLSTATTGAEALRKVLEREFAVILLDVMMPDMDGFELATIIKQRERSKHTPIIFMTSAGADMSFIYRAYSIGAVDYLAKPIDPDVFKAKVGIFVDLFRKDRRIKLQAEALRAADRRERELELAEVRMANERRYRNLAEAIPQIVWTANPIGVVTYFNQRWFEYTGQAPEEALAEGWKGAVHPDDLPRYLEHWDSSLGSSKVFELECRLRRNDGEYRWHLCRAVPERDDDTDQILGWLGTNTDFDDRKRALDAAHEAVSARDEFLSIASHELRTPLTTLQLRLQSLEFNLADVFASGREGLRRKLSSAMGQGRRLISLVDNLLDVARITNGKLTLQRESFDLGDSIREVTDSFAEMAHSAGCDVEVRTEGTLVGNWDRLRVEQVVQNLLGNAIKYAPKAPIQVGVVGAADKVTISVRDHGMGIAAVDVERVFGQFERAVSARQYGGLGMGLYIARQIAVAHGGTIRASSTPGDGSTFMVELPRG
jgi:PAS domain S-box-containing protein